MNIVGNNPFELWIMLLKIRKYIKGANNNSKIKNSPIKTIFSSQKFANENTTYTYSIAGL